MKKYRAITTVITTCFLSMSAHDIDPDSVFDFSINIDQVVVTGTRTPKLLKDSPILTRVISEKDIKKVDATNISDLMQAELPGIEFTYSMNQQVSLNMQGFSGNSVLFLVDGERLAGETLDNIDYSRLNLADVGRIEIVKGASSSLYGSNAVGGVINLISRELTKPWEASVSARYGSHNEQRYVADAGFRAGIVSSLTTIQRTSIDSYSFKNPGEYNKFFGGHTWNFKERLSITPFDKLKIVARAGYFFRQRSSSDVTNDRYRDFNGELRGFYTISPKSDIELSYNFDQYDKSDFVISSGKDIRKYSNVQHSGRAIFNHSFPGGFILTAGADVMRDYLLSYQFSDNGHKKQITADGFAQLDMNFIPRLNIIAGLRYDYFSMSRMKHASSKISAMYKLGRWNLRGSYSGGFRAPSLKEMYMDFDMASVFMIYGNPDLKAESSNNFQISGEYSRGLLNFNAGGFFNIVDDRITTAWSRYLNGMIYTNIPRMNIVGVDASLSWRTHFGLGTRLSYVYTHEDIRKGTPVISATRPHTATARIDYARSWPKYSFNIALNARFLSQVTADEYTSYTDYTSTERVTYPSYLICKLNITQNVWRGVNVILSVDNLFNYIPKYYYNNSPVTNGTTFSAGLSLDISEMCGK